MILSLTETFINLYESDILCLPETFLDLTANLNHENLTLSSYSFLRLTILVTISLNLFQTDFVIKQKR